MSIKGLSTHYSSIVARYAVDEESNDELMLAIKILPLIIVVKTNPADHSKHAALCAFIMSEKLDNEFVKAYMDEFEELAYHSTAYGKVWKDAEGKLHRTTKDANGMTKPARIDDDGDMMWAIHGQHIRNDLDEFGNALPSVITRKGTRRVWYNKDTQRHRAELGKNPADEANYMKALPAEIDGCSKSYYFNGNTIDRDELTKKIIARQNKTLNDVQKIKIVLKNGGVIEVNTGVATIFMTRL